MIAARMEFAAMWVLGVIMAGCTVRGGFDATKAIACTGDAECENGQTCVTGACRLNNGQSCTVNSECVGVCINSVCAPRSASGGPCDEPDDCQAVLACTGGLCAAVTLPPSSPAFMQGAGNDLKPGCTTLSQTFLNITGDATLGTYLIVFGSWQSPTVSCGSPCMADTQGNSWICEPAKSDLGLGYTSVLCYAPVSGAGGPDTITMNVASNVNDCELYINEYRNVGGIDAFCANSGSGGNASCSVTTTDPTETLVGGIINDNNCAAGVGFLTRVFYNGNVCEDKTADNTGTYPITFNTDSSASWIMLGLALRGM